MTISKKQKLGFWGWLLVGLLLITGTTETVAAQDLYQSEALKLIADFADRICKDIPIGGTDRTIEITGSANVELNKLIRKLVDLGIKGAVKYKNSEYQGVLQEDLVMALKNSADCKLAVIRELKDQLLKLKPESDDLLYIYDNDPTIKSIREGKGDPRVGKTIITAYVLGSFGRTVARHGKDYKTYQIPKPFIYRVEYSAQPSAVYSDKQGRKFRKVKIWSRVDGEDWKYDSEEVFMFIEGDWVLFYEKKAPGR